MGMLGGAVAGGIMDMASQGMQMEHQRDSQRRQNAHEWATMDKAYDMNMRQWEETNYQAQMRQMNKAGLNVGLMYGKGGAGGATVGNNQGSPRQGAMPTATNNAGMLAAQGAQIESQMKLVEAQTEKTRAEAKNIEAQTTTEDNKRDIFIAKLKQEGIGTWYDNLEKRFMREGIPEGEAVEVLRHQVFDIHASGYDSDSPAVNKFNQELLNMASEGKNIDANTLLTNQKAMGYWKELMNATLQAESGRIQAMAHKLSAEWTTGDYINWRTWVEIAQDASGMIRDVAGAVRPKKGNTTTIRNHKEINNWK